MRRRYTSEQRAQLVGLVADGDLTVPEAAARLGVTTSAAYNWVAESRKLRKQAASRPVAGPAFARLVPSNSAERSLVVRVAGADIHVRRDFDGELLRAVVATLLDGAA